MLRTGFAQLAEALWAARTAPSADEALVRMVLAYCDFAWRAPELYQVMHGIGGVPFRIENKPPEIKAGFLLMLDGLQAFERANNIRLANPERAVETLWALAHGIVSLALTERIAGGHDAARALAERAVRDLLAAWRTGA